MSDDHPQANWGQPIPPPHDGYPQAQGYGIYPQAPFGRDPMTGWPYSDKSKIAAGLLQIFLGTLGIGRFYLGYTGLGLTQLLLTLGGWLTIWLLIGVPVVIGVQIWALIDGILMLTGSVRDPQGRPLRP